MGSLLNRNSISGLISNLSLCVSPKYGLSNWQFELCKALRSDSASSDASLTMWWEIPDLPSYAKEFYFAVFCKHSTFMLKVKQLPRSMPSDSTWIVPPLVSTICFTIVRPSPIPSEFIVEVRWSLPNLVKSLLWSSLAMPTPESLTDTKMLPRGSLYQARIIMEPFSVNLRAFLTKLINTC